MSLLCLYCIITNNSFRRSHSSVCLNQQCQLSPVKLVGSWRWCPGSSRQPRHLLSAPRANRLRSGLSLALLPRSSCRHQPLPPLPLPQRYCAPRHPISFSVTNEWESAGDSESVHGWTKRGFLNKQKLYLETVRCCLNRKYAPSSLSGCGSARLRVH